MISSTAEYALRAILYVAQHDRGGPVRVAEVAAALDLPQNYLSKVLHELARSRVLASTRGKHGGFRLAKPPGHISLHSVVGQFDRLDARRACLLGRRDCNDRRPCAAHGRWTAVANETTRFFKETTIAELLVDGAEASPA